MEPNLSAALTTAEERLAQRRMILDALVACEKELPAVIEARLAAERHLADVESSAALGQGDAKATAAARKALTAARESLDGALARQRGLKQRILQQADELIAAHTALQGLLPEYRQSLEAEFATEWHTACADFGRVLAKREALESALAFRFSLPEPEAMGPAEQGDLARPGVVLTRIQSAINEVNGQRRAELRATAGSRRPAFDPHGVYSFRKAWQTYKVGDRILPEMLDAGMGSWLFEHNYLDGPLEAASA